MNTNTFNAITFGPSTVFLTPPGSNFSTFGDLNITPQPGVGVLAISNNYISQKKVNPIFLAKQSVNTVFMSKLFK